VVPHASGPYSYHFLVSQINLSFQEYLANSRDGQSVAPVFGDLFLDEPIPVNGYLDTTPLDKPRFGLTLNPTASLIPAKYLLTPDPARPLGGPTTAFNTVVAVADDTVDAETAAENGELGRSTLDNHDDSFDAIVVNVESLVDYCT